MNPEFKQWLEQQTYQFTIVKKYDDTTGVWMVIDEEYNGEKNYKWLNVVYRYELFERVRKA
jgi:hypothetical protein